MFGNINHIVLLFMLLCLQVLTKTKVTRLRTKPGKISSELHTVKYPEDGWGGGDTQQSFVRGGSARRSKPLPFFIIFD